MYNLFSFSFSSIWVCFFFCIHATYSLSPQQIHLQLLFSSLLLLRISSSLHSLIFSTNTTTPHVEPSRMASKGSFTYGFSYEYLISSYWRSRFCTDSRYAGLGYGRLGIRGGPGLAACLSRDKLFLLFLGFVTWKYNQKSQTSQNLGVMDSIHEN